MNCKPGDIAIYTGNNPKFIGMKFKIIEPAPLEPFTLPNGGGHVAGRPGCWVLESIDNYIQVSTDQGPRTVKYGVGEDAFLRPITLSMLA